MSAHDTTVCALAGQCIITRNLIDETGWLSLAGHGGGMMMSGVTGSHGHVQGSINPSAAGVIQSVGGVMHGVGGVMHSQQQHQQQQQHGHGVQGGMMHPSVGHHPLDRHGMIGGGGGGGQGMMMGHNVGQMHGSHAEMMMASDGSTMNIAMAPMCSLLT